MGDPGGSFARGWARTDSRAGVARVVQETEPVRACRRSMGTLPMPGSIGPRPPGLLYNLKPCYTFRFTALTKFWRSPDGAHRGCQPACPEARLGRPAEYLWHRPDPVEAGLRV